MWILPTLILLPMIEIALFILVGGWIGLWPTLALVMEGRLDRQSTTVVPTPAGNDTTQPAPIDETPTPRATVETPRVPDTAPAPKPAATVASADSGARYILQAGAFGASGDAEATKAKIAMLGLSARVESAQINGKTDYRVRKGPYGTASELAEAKQKLTSGGLPAMAVKAQ